MNKCEKCGFLHYRTDPCRKPKVRISIEASDNALTTPKSGVSAPPPCDMKVHTQSNSPAMASEAGPVRVEMAWGQNRIVRGGGPERAPGAEIPLTKPKFDKKAWMREYMREHRRGIRRRAAK